MAKFMFYASTRYVGAEREEVVEVPDEELEGMSEEQVFDYVYDNYFIDWINENCDIGFSLIEEEEE